MYTVKIDYDVCEHSEFCFDVCPEDVFEQHTSQIVVSNPDRCTACYLCVNNCPTGAVTVE